MTIDGSSARAIERPVKVLVIDDSDVFVAACRDVVSSIPSFVGVGEASSGEEGLALAATVNPDLVVVDIILPGIDGLETCRRLRGRSPAPLVVLCSVDDDPRLSGRNLPCSDSPYISKAAFSPAALLAAWQRRASPSVGEHVADTPARPIARESVPLDARAGAQPSTSLRVPITSLPVEVRHMTLGPVELLVVKFPGNRFTGEIMPALRELVDSNTIGIIDILLAVTDNEGNVSAVEVSEDEDAYRVLQPIVKEIEGLLTPADIEALGKQLGANSSAAVMLFENKWATRFRDAVFNAKGEVVMLERIPKQVIEAMMEEPEPAAVA
jgi:DNA-binding NarL/FixJ family response regulator